jgi:two-component system, NarL family, sensor kinase
MDPQETRMYTALIIAVFLIGAIFIYFTVSIVRQQKRSLQLQVQNALAEISAMERERSRIANDLHDDIGPLLSVIKFLIDGVETANSEDQQDLQKATAQIDEAVTRLREIAVNLMPSSLLRKGLITAIEEFLSRLKQPGLTVAFEHKFRAELPQEKSINLFRLTQETVHNAIKHANANHIHVSLNENNDWINLLIRDNGSGFDFDTAIKSSSGFGLRSLSNRAKLMKGTMTVQSKPNIGTAFLFEIPSKDV